MSWKALFVVVVVLIIIIIIIIVVVIVVIIIIIIIITIIVTSLSLLICTSIYSSRPVSAMLRSVWRKAQMMESITSLSWSGDMVNRVPKQWLVMARSRP